MFILQFFVVDFDKIFLFIAILLKSVLTDVKKKFLNLVRTRWLIKDEKVNLLIESSFGLT